MSAKLSTDAPMDKSGLTRPPAFPLAVGQEIELHGHRWQVEGIHLGALGQESLIQLKGLSHEPGWTGPWEFHPMLFVPEIMLSAALSHSPPIGEQGAVAWLWCYENGNRKASILPPADGEGVADYVPLYAAPPAVACLPDRDQPTAYETTGDRSLWNPEVDDGPDPLAPPSAAGEKAKDWDLIRAHPCYDEHQPDCDCDPTNNVQTRALEALAPTAPQPQVDENRTDLEAAARRAYDLLQTIVAERRKFGPIATHAQSAAWQINLALRGQGEPASVPQADMAVAIKALEGHRNLELSYSYGDEDEDGGWCVHQVNGGRNDREWTLIAKAETAADALTEALRKLEKAGV